ncbi:hypothetical protein E4U53_000141 [Claviceps sorghi]|nr:hypothetical protein E4U53_000141 [Claviceps sorghi]
MAKLHIYLASNRLLHYFFHVAFQYIAHVFKLKNRDEHLLRTIIDLMERNQFAANHHHKPGNFEMGEHADYNTVNQHFHIWCYDRPERNIRTHHTYKLCNGDKQRDNALADDEPQPVLTTLETLISTERGTPEPQASDSASSTNTVQAQAHSTPNLPKNPNFPWGGDSPLHRHQSVTALGAGIPRESLWTRWTNKVKNKMRLVRL